jgi:hypothetical protein
VAVECMEGRDEVVRRNHVGVVYCESDIALDDRG